MASTSTLWIPIGPPKKPKTTPLNTPSTTSLIIRNPNPGIPFPSLPLSLNLVFPLPPPLPLAQVIARSENDAVDITAYGSTSFDRGR